MSCRQSQTTSSSSVPNQNRILFVSLISTSFSNFGCTAEWGVNINCIIKVVLICCRVELMHNREFPWPVNWLHDLTQKRSKHTLRLEMRKGKITISMQRCKHWCIYRGTHQFSNNFIYILYLHDTWNLTRNIKLTQIGRL